jgi:hypothetical protein
MRGSYVPADVPPQHDDCYCEGQARHIHHPWAVLRPDHEPGPSRIRLAARQGGKTSAARRAVYEARDRGEHVHIATGKGEFCAAREQPDGCHSPRWEGLEPC